MFDAIDESSASDVDQDPMQIVSVALGWALGDLHRTFTPTDENTSYHLLMVQHKNATEGALGDLHRTFIPNPTQIIFFIKNTNQ